MRNFLSQRLKINCLRIIQIELEFRNVIFEGRGKPEFPEKKTLEARTKTNNKLDQPTYDAESGNRTRATFEGGEYHEYDA